MRALFLLVFVFVLIWSIVSLLKKRLSRLRRVAGISGRVKDQDLDGSGAKQYMNPQVGIMCKPDILLKNRLIEYKSAHCKGKPFPADILQLTAEMMATGAKEAELRYGNGRTFVFSINDPIIQATKVKILAIIGEMRVSLATGKAPQALPAAKKCAVCAFARECSFSLAA